MNENYSHLEDFDKSTNSKSNPFYIDSSKSIYELKNNLLKNKINNVWLKFKCTGKWCKDKNNTVIKKITTVKYLKKSDLQCRGCCTKGTNLRLYGVENVFQAKFIKEKIRKSNLEKYGVENPSQSKKIKKKKIETCKKHFGVENPMQSEKVIRKVIVTNNERYGCDYTCQNETIREKQYKTQREHYDGKLYFETEDSKKIGKIAKLKKYGNENYINKEKIIETNNKRYGSDYFQQSEYYTDKKKKLASKKRNKTLEKHYGIGHSIREDYLYKNHVFNSSWELAVFIWARNFKKKIIQEPIYFTYKVNNKVYRYYPDFSINNELIEIKGDQFFKYYKNGNIKSMINPYDSSKNEEYKKKFECMKKNKVTIWTQKDIQPILLYIKNKYGKNYLEKFKKKEYNE